MQDQCNRKLIKEMDQKYSINGSNDFFDEQELTKLKIGINFNLFQYEFHLIIKDPLREYVMMNSMQMELL